jgi:hypothetical protein
MAEHLEEDDDVRREVMEIVREVLELDEQEYPDDQLGAETLSDLGAKRETRTLIAERIEAEMDIEVPETFIQKRGLTVRELADQVIALLDEEDA